MRFRTSILLGSVLAAVLIAAGGTASAAEPARSELNINYNTDEIGPPDANLNSLDLYLPAVSGERGSSLAPLVVWVHGGGFMTGDKLNRIPNKARLFNDLGYVFASINYRLSPDISGNCCDFDPFRVRAPDHISDLAEAIGWLSRHAAPYGGDPDRIVLIGHSAGAQLVSLAGTSPAWIRGGQASPKQVLGVVSLDTDTFDVAAEAADSSPLQARMLAWNAFGTPEEEAVEPMWDRMSPILHADPTDPEFLFVTQSTKPGRMAANQGMATKLGQDPATSVVGVPYDHETINTMLGSPNDSSVETARVSEFVQSAVADAEPAGVRFTKRPAGRVMVKVKRRATRKATRKALRRAVRKVTFRFAGTGRASGFQCRIDGKPFSTCRSPRSYRLKAGKHAFRVRPLYPSGRPGKERRISFRIVARRSRH